MTIDFFEGDIKMYFPEWEEMEESGKVGVNTFIRQFLSFVMPKIPKRFWEADLARDFPRMKRVIGESLFLPGQCGSGKTHLAIAILKYDVLHKFANYVRTKEPYDKRFEFVSVFDLLAEVKRTYEKDACTTEYEVIAKYSNTPLLVLDDLCAERPTDYNMSVLMSIINHRYNEMIPTIITSNLGLKQMALQFSDRIASRLTGMCSVLEMNGRDRRTR